MFPQLKGKNAEGQVQLLLLHYLLNMCVCVFIQVEKLKIRFVASE